MARADDREDTWKVRWEDGQIVCGDRVVARMRATCVNDEWEADARFIEHALNLARRRDVLLATLTPAPTPPAGVEADEAAIWFDRAVDLRLALEDLVRVCRDVLGSASEKCACPAGEFTDQGDDAPLSRLASVTTAAQRTLLHFKPLGKGDETLVKMTASRDLAAHTADEAQRVAIRFMDERDAAHRALQEVLNLFIDPSGITDLPDYTKINPTFSSPTLGHLKRWRAALAAPPAGHQEGA